MIGLGLGLGIDKARGVDPDVASFISRSGITNTTQKNAITTLTRSLKASGLWSKLIGLYPFVGGTAQAHAQNLRSASYTITWINAPTHNATGVTCNGTTQYGILTNTAGIIPQFGHISAYLQVATAGIRDLCGAGNQAANAIYFILQPNANTIVGYLSHLSVFAQSGVGSWNSLLSVHRRSTTDLSVYFNDTLQGSNATPRNDAPPDLLDLYAFCRNDNGGPTSFAADTLSMLSFGSGMTAGEITSFNTAIQQYETTLGRNV